MEMEIEVRFFQRRNCGEEEEDKSGPVVLPGSGEERRGAAREEGALDETNNRQTEKVNQSVP